MEWQRFGKYPLEHPHRGSCGRVAVEFVVLRGHFTIVPLGSHSGPGVGWRGGNRLRYSMPMRSLD